MLNAKFFVLILVVVLLSGCVMVRPSDRDLIDNKASNAAIFSDKVKDKDEVPQYVKDWIAQEARFWGYMSDWANGRNPQ